MSQPEDILQKFRDNRGFKVNALPAGTKVAVNTKNSLYEFVVLDNRHVSAFGGTKKDGSVRFRHPTKLTIAGSTFGGSMIRSNWIGEEMLMELLIEEGKDQGHVLVTSPVQNVTIESQSGDWYLPLEWRK